jgi:hypothetical protein
MSDPNTNPTNSIPTPTTGVIKQDYNKPDDQTPKSGLKISEGDVLKTATLSSATQQPTQPTSAPATPQPTAVAQPAPVQPAPTPIPPATYAQPAPVIDIPLSAINPQAFYNQPQPIQPQPLTPQQLDPYAGLGNDSYINNFDQSYYDPAFGLNYGANDFDENTGLSQAAKIASTGGKGLLKFIQYQWKILLALATIVTLLALSYNLFVGPTLQTGNLGNLGSYANVKASIDAPASLPQGLPGTWVITISNEEAVAINNLRLELDFDEDFQYLSSINKSDTADGSVYSINRLDPVGRGLSSTKITLTGVLNGSVDEDTVMSGIVKYIPDPLAGAVRGQRQIEIAGAKTRISSSEVRVSLTPTTGVVATGEQAEFTVNIRNTRETDFTDVQIRMIYPGGGAFRYDSSEFNAGNFTEPKNQPDNGDNIWNISRLPGRAEQVLKVRGKVSGIDQVRLTFGVEVSTRTDGINYRPIATTFKDIIISAQPLLLKTFINNVDNQLFEEGGNLSFSVSYENQGREVLKNIEIFASIDDPANLLDYSTLSFVGGERIGINNERVQWSGNNTPQLVNLAPGSKGELKFNIQAKKGFEFYKDFETQDKYTLQPRVDARASNLQNFAVSGPLYKAKGGLFFEQAEVIQLPTPSSYKENERLFLVTWYLSTLQNRVKDVKLSSSTPLQPTAWNQESVNPPAVSDRINYNQFSGAINWDIGTIEPYSGNNRERIVASFELRVEFSGNENTRILTAPNITGVDEFTGQTYRINGRDISVNRNKR